MNLFKEKEPAYIQLPPRDLANKIVTVYDTLVSQDVWKITRISFPSSSISWSSDGVIIVVKSNPLKDLQFWEQIFKAFSRSG